MTAETSASNVMPTGPIFPPVLNFSIKSGPSMSRSVAVSRSGSDSVDVRSGSMIFLISSRKAKSNKAFGLDVVDPKQIPRSKSKTKFQITRSAVSQAPSAMRLSRVA